MAATPGSTYQCGCRGVLCSANDGEVYMSPDTKCTAHDLYTTHSTEVTRVYPCGCFTLMNARPDNIKIKRSLCDAHSRVALDKK